MPSAARQYAPFLGSRTSSKSPIPYGLAKSMSARLISGASLSLCFARTGKSKSPVPHFVGDRAFAREWLSIRLRIASRSENPASHVFLAAARHAGTARERARRRISGVAAPIRRASANACSSARRTGRCERDVLRHAVLLSSCLPRAVAHEGRHHVTDGGLSKGKGNRTFRQFRRLTRRNVFRSGAATSSRPRRSAPARNSGNRPFQGVRASRSCGRRSPRLRSNRCASCASWSWLRFPYAAIGSSFLPASTRLTSE